jgi:hypothetical protein
MKISFYNLLIYKKNNNNWKIKISCEIFLLINLSIKIKNLYYYDNHVNYYNKNRTLEVKTVNEFLIFFIEYNKVKIDNNSPSLFNNFFINIFKRYSRYRKFLSFLIF